MSTDVYAYWRACVAAGCKRPVEAVELMLPTVGAPIAGENPQAGLWKARPAKGQAHTLLQVWLSDEKGQPVYQWRDGLTVRAVLGKHALLPDEVTDRWLYVLPATKAEAAHWREHGRWPADPEPLPARDHNMPADPFAALQLEVDDRLDQFARWLTVTAPIQDKTDCDKARNMQAELLALLKKADAMHEAEKRPHLEAGRAVDRRFGFREQVKDLAASLRFAFETYMNTEERRLQDEQRRAYDAEREIAATAGEDPPPPPEPVKVQAGGGVGRKAGLRDSYDFEIVEYKLAALHVIEQPDVSAAVGKVIARMVRASKGAIEIPGVKISKSRKAA